MSSGPATVSPQRRSVGHRARRAARAASRRLSFSASSQSARRLPDVLQRRSSARCATRHADQPRLVPIDHWVPDIGFHPGDHVGQRSRGPLSHLRGVQIRPRGRMRACHAQRARDGPRREPCKGDIDGDAFR